MSGVDLGRAECGHDHQAHRLVGTGHVAQQLQGRHVGPLQVIEHENHRMRLPSGLEDLDDRAEQQVAGRFGIGRTTSTRFAQGCQRRTQPRQIPPRGP